MTFLLFRMISAMALGAGAFLFVSGSYDWFARKIRENSTQYIAWMVTMFDRMFLTVTARQSVMMIVGSTLGTIGLGWFLTQGLTGETWKYVIRSCIVLTIAYGPFG